MLPPSKCSASVVKPVKLPCSSSPVDRSADSLCHITGRQATASLRSLHAFLSSLWFLFLLGLCGSAVPGTPTPNEVHLWGGAHTPLVHQQGARYNCTSGSWPRGGLVAVADSPLGVPVCTFFVLYLRDVWGMYSPQGWGCVGGSFWDILVTVQLGIARGCTLGTTTQNKSSRVFSRSEIKLRFVLTPSVTRSS